ncbi:CAP domain-containing protein [Bacillus sp. DNRA2]|uniref:CAP domain-containing protein n=1 Tax=Bacillus sp. DNRA2 TaxID=2723053 RepID=UPI002006E9B0|nr:CAP domain-containing protein [Bacillus sp. DNRA2]
MKGELGLAALIRILVLVVIVLLAGYYIYDDNNKQSDILYMEDTATPELDQGKVTENSELVRTTKLQRPENGLSTFLGKQADAFKAVYGEPNRMDPSTYGYEWWIYNQNSKEYMQVGVESGKIVTIYALGENFNLEPFKVGETIEEIFSTFQIQTDIHFNYEGTAYKFELSEEDMNSKPLIQMGDMYVQLNIDKFTGSLVSVRYLDVKTLIVQRPYELMYRGELLEPMPVTDEAWPLIEQGSQKQIFEITNILRKRYHLPQLVWDDAVANVAYLHSKDMNDTNSLSHTSKQYGEVTDRLNNAQIHYDKAGEIIAANYIDAPAVIEGWINSEHHRENLLDEKFTHTGVGVYRKHYTQNLIETKEENE